MYHKINPMHFKRLRHWLSAPLILGMIIPLVLFDISMEIYHRIAFPLYGLAYVKRSEYIKIDRHRLLYLSLLNKIWCAYCGYANGLVAYWVAIAGRTESYWCGIKHQPSPHFHEPLHQKDFLTYGDEQAYREYCKLGEK